MEERGQHCPFVSLCLRSCSAGRQEPGAREGSAPDTGLGVGVISLGLGVASGF